MESLLQKEDILYRGFHEDFHEGFPGALMKRLNTENILTRQCMKKIIVFAGTTEGRDIARFIAEQGISVTVSVATEYGKQVMEDCTDMNGLENITLLMGRLDEAGMEKLMISGDENSKSEARDNSKDEYTMGKNATSNYDMVIDATHPYAVEVSKNIKNAATKCNLEYVRISRTTGIDSEIEKMLDGLDIVRCKNTDEAVNALIGLIDGLKCGAKEDRKTDVESATKPNILITTGSKEIHKFARKELMDNLYVRVLPGLESISLCENAGIKGKHIIAMQGPFSSEMNAAIMKQFNIGIMVTKESGSTGGYMEKLEAAKAVGAKVIVIGNPEIEKGYSLSEVKAMICPEAIGGKSVQEVDVAEVEVKLLGIGLGSKDYMTSETASAIENADMIFGAKRMIEAAKKSCNIRATEENIYEYYLARDIIPVIERNVNSEQRNNRVNVVVLFSGDTGFYSGAEKLKTAFCDTELYKNNSLKVEINPGISSIQYFASKCGISWGDGRIISLHGVSDENRFFKFAKAVKESRKTFAILSGVEDLHRIVSELEDEFDASSEMLEIYVGYNLSYSDEKIKCYKGLSISLVSDFDKEGLYVISIINENPDTGLVYNAISDDEFERARVPMTREDIRHLSILKLMLKKDSVLLDLGSGTGSISIEAAGLSSEIKVYAYECNPDAVSLMRQNIEKFNAKNIVLKEGMVPEIIDENIVPTHAFIGGSKGNMKEIVAKLFSMNKNIRVVATAVTLETKAELLGIIKGNEFSNVDISEVSVSRAKKLGDYNLMVAENTVMIAGFNA